MPDEGYKALKAGDRILVVANPSTRAEIDPIFTMLRQLAPGGVKLDMRLTQAAGDATDIVRAHGTGAAMVIAVGGDGTVAEVAEHLDHGSIPLGIIPAGSTNIVARELGLPTDIRKAAEMIWSSRRYRRIDAGTANGRMFLHMAGCGFDSRFFNLTDSQLKRKVGWIAYLPAAIKALQEPPMAYHLRTEKQEFDVISPLVLVANGGSIISPRLKLHSKIRNDDGWLNVLVITATTPNELARTLGRLATLQLEKSPYLMHLRVKELDVRSETPMPVELDGDVVTETPVKFRILPREIMVVCPNLPGQLRLGLGRQ